METIESWSVGFTCRRCGCAVLSATDPAQMLEVDKLCSACKPMRKGQRKARKAVLPLGSGHEIDPVRVLNPPNFERIAASLNEELLRLALLVQSIKDALGTDEDGENLVSVARDAHRAEMELGGHYLAGRLPQK